MNYTQIKVNPAILGIDETIKKNEEDLLNKSGGIFDCAVALDSIGKGLFNLIDKEGVSFEFKGNHLETTYYINSNISAPHIQTSVQGAYPVSSLNIVDFETEEIINKKILIKEGDNFTLGNGYTLIAKTFVFKDNDIGMLGTFSSHKSDYFHKILTIISENMEEEYSRYQLTVVPSTDYFKDLLNKNDHKLNNLKKQKGFNMFEKENEQLSISLKEMLSHISKEKFPSRGYFVNLRVHYFCKEENIQKIETKINLITNLVNGLAVYSSKLIEINEGGDYLYNYYNSVINHKAISFGSLLVKSELLNLVHFPILGNNKIPNLSLQLFDTLPMPSEVMLNGADPKQGVILGINNFAGKRSPFFMGNKQRLRHTYIIGKTGTGKSTIMENAILQDIHNGKGVFLLDPHGDLVSNIMKHFPDPRFPEFADRYKDLIYIDFGDTERCIGLNLLESKDVFEESKAINSFVELLKKLYPDSGESMGPTFIEYVTYAFKTVKLYEKRYKPTLSDIIRILVNDDYRKRALAQIKDRTDYIDLFAFWEQHDKLTSESSASTIKDELIPHIRTKLTKFLENPYVSGVISQPDSTIDFFEAMNSNKIILIKMSKGAIGEENMQFLGLIVISKLLIDIFKRESIPEEERKDFFIYVDEFQNFVTKEFEQILSEARKYRTGLTIAHQYLDQLIVQKSKDESLLNAVLGNVGTFITFRVGSKDAPKFEEAFGNKTILPKESFINIDKYNAYVSTGGGDTTTRTLPPFHILTTLTDKPKILKRYEEGESRGKVIGNGEIDFDIIKKIINFSKDKYYGSSEVVKAHRQRFLAFFGK